MKDELQSLIDLTKEYLSTQQQPSTSATTSTQATDSPRTTANSRKRDAPDTSTNHNNTTSSSSSSKAVNVSAASTQPQHHFKTGDECQARYSGDNKFYPARITSIGGSDSNLVYSIIFHGYSTTELVSHADVKPLNEAKKRELALSKEDEDKERKRKKYEKKAVTKAEKTAEQGAKQKTWQSFAKKGSKKGVVIPGVQGE